MNKKVEKPEFTYPFTDKEHEESLKFLDIRRMNMVSQRGSKVELTETMYHSSKYHKLELKETIYIKKSESKNLGEILYLRPYDQVKGQKYLVFVVNIKKDGKVYFARERILEKVAEVSNDQWMIIKTFYESKNVSLEDALETISSHTGGVYNTTGSLRSTINKINRKIKSAFKLTEKDKMISGEQGSGYSFNPHIRLNVIGD